MNTDSTKSTENQGTPNAKKKFKTYETQKEKKISKESPKNSHIKDVQQLFLAISSVSGSHHRRTLSLKAVDSHYLHMLASTIAKHQCFLSLAKVGLTRRC